jgi:hypothetical protein
MAKNYLLDFKFKKNKIGLTILICSLTKHLRDVLEKVFKTLRCMSAVPMTSGKSVSLA